PLLKRAQRAKVINISSIAGRKASPGMGIYSIAKAGLDMFTKVLGAELASYGINVNAVAPGMVRTDFSKPLWSQPEMLREIESRIPMARIGEIEEVVGAVIFLSSPMANYITGEVFVVDGGAQVW
ncbi:MAG: SDR family NAD(P)-dependent oxidoreductase, partial [Desulfatiglandales bacterium]